MSDGMVAQGITVTFAADLSSLTDAVASAKGILSDFASSVSSISSSTSNALSSAFSGLNNIDMSGVKSEVSDVASELIALGSDATDAGEKLIEAGNGTGSFKESLSMISSSLQALGSNIGGVISGRLSALASGIQQLGINIANAASGPINSFIGKIQDLANKISDAASGPINSFIDKTQNLYNSVVNVASNAFQGFADKVALVGSTISNAVSGPINAFTDGIQKVASTISDMAFTAFNNFTNGVQKIASNISDAVSGPINNLTSGIQQVGSKISDTVSGPINSFTSGVQQVGSKIGDAVSGPFNAFTNSIKGFASDIGEAASGPLADFIGGIKSLGSNISEAASGPLNTISGGVKSTFSGMQNMAQGAMDSIKNAFTSAKPSLSDFLGSIRGAASGVSGFVSSIAGMAGIHIPNLSDPIGLLNSTLTDSINIAQKHKEIMDQTTRTLGSTGDASRMTAQSIEGLADSFSQSTKFSEDTVQSGENLLLTFTHIGKQVFPDATKSMLDMSQALGISTTKAAKDLGKALDDPLKAIKDLSKEHVNFTAAQQKSIQTMMAHNNIAGAQKIVLQAVQGAFGGAAQAAGNTFSGQLQILQNSMNNVKEKIGSALLPILSQLTGAITSTVLPAINKFSDWLSSPAFQNFATGVGKAISDAFTTIGNVLKTIDWKSFEGDFSSLGQQLGSIVSGLKPPSNNLFKDIGGAIKTVVKDVGDFAKDMSGVVKWFKDGSAPATVLKDALIGIGIAFGLMKVGQFVASLPALVAGIWGWATAQGAVAIETLITALPYIAIGALVVGIVALIALAIQHWGDIAKWLTGVWQGVAKWFEDLWKGIQSWFGGVGKWFQDRFAEAYKGVMSAIGGLGQWFQDRWKDIQKAFGSVGNWFHDLWQGVCNDFNSVLGGLGNFATNIWNSITGAVKAGFNYIIDLVNNVIQTIDNIKVAGFGVSIPLIPHLASGIENFVGGIALVGEKGPELVNLPKGSSVLNAGDTASLFQGKSNFKYPSMPQGASSQPIVVNVHPIVQPNDIHVDGKKLTDVMATYMAGRIRMEGIKNR